MSNFIHPSELKKRYPILAKKSFGQNFLVHGPILKTISQKILEHKPTTVLEIGPGPASLSQLLASQIKNLILVEKDLQFKDLLEEILLPYSPAIQLYIEDFLFCDLEKILKDKEPPIFAVGNLPYHVSVPILEKLLLNRKYFSRFYLMFQKEVAERICAKPGTKAYGSLSLFCQMQADCKIVLSIPPSAFQPRPKIYSAVMEIVPLRKNRFEVDFELFQKLIRSAFQTRRKTLLNSLLGGKIPFKKQDLETLLCSLSIAPTRRAETLSLEEFAKLAISLSPLYKGGDEMKQLPSRRL